MGYRRAAKWQQVGPNNFSLGLADPIFVCLLLLSRHLMHCSYSHPGLLLPLAAVIIVLACRTRDGTKSTREKLELIGKNISAVQLKLNQCSQEVKAKESEVIDFERKLVAPPLRRRHSLE